MMKKNWFDTVPPRSLMYVICCFAVLIAFIVIVLLPSYRSLGELDHEVEKIESRIKTQQRLMPFYMRLVKKTEEKVPSRYPLPGVKAIPEKSIDLIPSIFKGVARRSSAELVLVNPDFTTLAKGKGRILINATMRGSFVQIRRFLIEMGAVPYLQHIEEVDIHQRTDGKELKMKVWLNVS